MRGLANSDYGLDQPKQAAGKGQVTLTRRSLRNSSICTTVIFEPRKVILSIVLSLFAQPSEGLSRLRDAEQRDTSHWVGSCVGGGVCEWENPACKSDMIVAGARSRVGTAGCQVINTKHTTQHEAQLIRLLLEVADHEITSCDKEIKIKELEVKLAESRKEEASLRHNYYTHMHEVVGDKACLPGRVVEERRREGESSDVRYVSPTQTRAGLGVEYTGKYLSAVLPAALD
ncbi:hypothetical protein B0H14DRAFT_2623716 [Mycena olivaceomarginata]|nr:hypothetical protein B0H14DRAFT_2623716 [Mycena olivaceomarginata]